jgi:hypothetical protein
MHTWRRVLILMEAWTCINPRVPCVPLSSISVSTPTLKSCHKLWQLAPTVGLTRSSFERAMSYQSTTKFSPGSGFFLGSLQFIIDKFRDLTLQELESREVIGSCTDRLPPVSVWVSLINETWLRHRLSKLGKTDLEGPEKTTRGGWMGANQNSLSKHGLYLEIDPKPLSSNSAKTT